MGKFCTNCGSEIKRNAAFCSKCGAKIIEDNKDKDVVVGEVVNDGNNNNNNNNNNTINNGVAKSKIAAGLLGIFLGSFGVHNFYLGYTGKAVGQLLITVLSCGFLSFVSAIWGLVEGILILTGSINVDAEGNYLID